eukprot:COSAG05_NODE_1095_length_5901_cov_26.506205_3_plen_463_part_00
MLWSVELRSPCNRYFGARAGARVRAGARATIIFFHVSKWKASQINRTGPHVKKFMRIVLVAVKPWVLHKNVRHVEAKLAPAKSCVSTDKWLDTVHVNRGGVLHNFRASSPPGERPSEPPPRPPPSAPRRRNILGDLVEPTPPPRGDSSDEEQEGSGVSVCAFSISTLRKAVTQKRKQERITGAKGRTQLLELLLAHRKLPGVAAAITSEHALDGQNVADLRRNWRKVSAAYHKPVSKMKLPEIIKYMYATAFHLSYDWSDVLQGKDTKKRISAACKDAAQPGQTDGSAPSGALPGKKKAPKKSQTKRAPPQRPEFDDNDLDIEDFPQAAAAPRPTYDLEAGRRILERRKQIQARRREEPLTVPARKKRSQPAPKPSSTSGQSRCNATLPSILVLGCVLSPFCCAYLGVARRGGSARPGRFGPYSLTGRFPARAWPPFSRWPDKLGPQGAANEIDFRRGGIGC